MDNTTVYKIYNPKTNKYSRGGKNIHNLWSNTGKVWTSYKNFKLHLSMLQHSVYGGAILKEYEGCQLVTLKTSRSDSPLELYL